MVQEVMVQVSIWTCVGYAIYNTINLFVPIRFKKNKHAVHGKCGGCTGCGAKSSLIKNVSKN